MEITSLTQIWKYLTWLPKFLLKRIFKKQRLSDLVYVDIKPRGESIRVNINEDSSFIVYFMIINMSPFDVELDRAEFDINFSGIGITNQHLKKSTIRSGQISYLSISGSIDSNKAAIISRSNSKSNGSSISVYMVYKCSIHEFEKNGYLDELNVVYNEPKKD